MALFPIVTRKRFESEITAVKKIVEASVSAAQEREDYYRKEAEWQTVRASNAKRQLHRVVETTNTILIGSSRAGERGQVIVQPDGSLTGARNDYRERETLIREIRNKYKGISEHGGNNPLERMVEFKTTFILGRGFRAMEREIPITMEDGAEDAAPPTIPTPEEAVPETVRQEISPEMRAIQSFIRFNKLDGSTSEKLGTMAHLEGGIAVSLHPVTDANGVVVNIGMRLYDWHKEKWEPTWNDLGGEENELAGLKTLTFFPEDDTGGNSLPAKKVPGEQAIAFYLNAVGREKEGRPIVNTASLNLIEDIDRAHADLREYNRYFGTPTPHLQTEDAEEMAAVLKMMDEDNSIRMGKMLVAPGKLTMVEASGKGVEALIEEITVKVKALSGATGISSHWMGWPDLTTNRSTAKEQKEPLSIAVSSEQAIYEENFTELFDKAIRMLNAESSVFSIPLQEGLIVASLKVLTESEMLLIEKVILPMTQSRQLPLKILLEMLEHILGHSTDEILQMVREQEQVRFSPTAAGTPGEITFPDDENAIAAAIAAARNPAVNVAGAGV